MIPLIRLLVIMTMYILSLLYIRDNFGWIVSSVYIVLAPSALVFLIFPQLTKTRD